MKKKDKGLRAIAVLAVATLVVSGASIAISNLSGDQDTVQETSKPAGNSQSTAMTGPKQPEGSTVLDVSGAGSNINIKAAYKKTDGSFSVVVGEEGFGGSMTVQIEYSADGTKVLSFDVVEGSETPGIGSMANEQEYKDKLANSILPIVASGMDISAIVGSAEPETEAPVSNEFKDGTYEMVGEPASNGYVAHVVVTILDGKIANVTWDEEKDGVSKAELSKNGQYVMKPVWATQADSMCEYVVNNQSTEGLNLNDAGKTDVVSGVSISVNEFVALVNKAIADAAGKDGVYTVIGEPASNGYVPHVVVSITAGKISAVAWDEEKDGVSKAELSRNGQYVMKPVWATQAESMTKYVVENQSTAGLNLNAAGKTDAVSGVSISVDGFVGLVNDALKNASASGELVVVEKPAAEATKVDVVSGATYSSKAIIRAIDAGYAFLRDCVLK